MLRGFTEVQNEVSQGCILSITLLFLLIDDLAQLIPFPLSIPLFLHTKIEARIVPPLI